MLNLINNNHTIINCDNFVITPNMPAAIDVKTTSTSSSSCRENIITNVAIGGIDDTSNSTTIGITPMSSSSTVNVIAATSAEIKTWEPRRLPQDQAIKKMWSNGVKAIKEHRNRDLKGSYAMSNESIEPLEVFINPQKLAPLNFRFETAEKRGPRNAMEDAHFFVDFEDGALSGVFDGHGGRQVAMYAKEQFNNRFQEQLKIAKNNVHQAFEQLFCDIHKEVVAKNMTAGSTTVLTYIDKNTHLIYTATLGDSEANVYREQDGVLQSIPLSCIRDWSSQKDALRAAKALDSPSIANDWPKVENPKDLYFPYCCKGSLNVSRAIGDKSLNMYKGKPGVIQKPKICVNKLKPKDILILTCDGIKDYVPEAAIIRLIKQNSNDLANRLILLALYQYETKDNVTVVVIYVDC